MLQTSLAGRSWRKLVICSRGMKDSVPADAPVAVMPESPACSKLLARPKSASLAAPSGPRRTLSGLMSRWTKPEAWAKASPSMAWRASGPVTSRVRGPSSRIRACTLPRGQYSIAQKKPSPSSPESRRATMFGWRSRRMTSASRSRCARASGPAPRRGSRSLSATSPPSLRRRAR